MTEYGSRQDAVERRTLSFDSHDGRSHIYAPLWTPAGDDAPVRGIVQIAHGMVEHIERYDDFARFLCGNGFVVCGCDHIGHGKSVDSPEGLGTLPFDGAQVMVSDAHSLRRIVSGMYPQDTPYYLFGHSMGSFVARSYLSRFGEGLSGAIICGTGQHPIILSKFAASLSRAIGRRKGEGYHSVLVDFLAIGPYSRSVKDARTAFDWLNTDPLKVDEYIADPACGGMFSVGGYASLTDLTAEVASKECVAAVPSGLPVLFIAGSEDPVGNRGRGVRAAAKAMDGYSEAIVEVRIYEGMRHEILNEPGHDEVYANVLEWLTRTQEGDRA